MSNTPNLHSENFDLCRICLLEPETNRQVKFIHIFAPNNAGLKLNQQMIELLGVKVEKNDIKPKIICENCHGSLLGWIEMKKKAAESQIVINYIATKKFGAVTAPGTYNSYNSRNKEASTKGSPSFTHLQSTSQQSNTTNFNGCGSSNINQGNSNRSFTTRHSISVSVDSESDDCSAVNNPVEVIEISDSEESVKVNFKNERVNVDENDKLYYCSICQKKNLLDHDCSQHNKSFSTCLVPNCNILSRSKKDFTPHYRQHIGMSSSAVMCRRCYQEIKKSDNHVNGCFHVRCQTANLFKCYACNVIFNNMEEFAYHKLKTHTGRLMNCYGNYLCFYCEASSKDLSNIIEHSKNCLENQSTNVTEYGMKLIKPTVNATESLSVKKSTMKMERKKGNGKKIPRSSTHVLFTCLKPLCNLIFQNFNVFKCHHREHFEFGNKLMCWQCCVPFSNLNSLRAHQVKGNCRTPGMFKCYECSEQFDDLQSLSIHKFTLHDGDLIATKKNNKTISCAFCLMEIHIYNFKSHLLSCQNYNVKSMKPKPKVSCAPKYIAPFKCVICYKVCLTAAALSSHMKIHNPSLPKRKVNKRTSNTSLKTENNLEMSNSSYNQVTDAEISKSTTSQHNDTTGFINNDMANTDENNEIKIEMNILSKNSPINARVNSLKTKPQNYYCTKCKKYYTRLSFAQHWRTNHGRRLQYLKYRRFSCKKCPLKFMYKIALLMHNEHIHGEQNSDVTATLNTAPNDTLVTLPIISETTSLAINIPETITDNNEDNNQPIKQEAILSVHCGVSYQENNIECTNIRNDEIDDLKNNEEHNMSNNNDDQAETDVYTDQNIIQMIDELNDSEAIENLILNENKMDVNNEYSMDVTEYTENINEKTISKMDDNEISISLVKEKESQNYLGGELVAINDTQNVSNVNEHQINFPVQEFPTSGE